MTEFDYPEEQVLSGFTLAFFEDLGYLHVIKNYTGGLMRFGKYKGCSFLREKCGDNLDNEEYQKVFSNEFYLPKDIQELPDYFEPSCSSGRLSKTVHKLYTTLEEKNEDHQFYSNYIIGKSSTKYCPISEYDTSSRTNTYIGLCSGKSQDASLEEKIGEFYSDKSFCVLSSLIKEADESYLKLRAVCYEMICSWLSLTIRIGDNYIVCPKEGGRIEAENFKGYLLCPDYNLICTGTKMCNSMFDCIDKESEEKENTFDYSDYNDETGILTTQNSDIYSTQEINYGWELSDNGTCPQFCMQCASNKICIKCAPHYIKEEDGKKCTEIVPNCKNYINISDDTCKECKTNYILAQDVKNGPLFCADKSLFEDDKKYYINSTNDYYKKCDNDGVEFCDTCQSDKICESCITGYHIIDDGLTCGDLSSKLYYQDSSDGNKYKSCIKNTGKPNCLKCEINEGNNFHCLECENNYAFFYDDPISNDCVLISSKTLNIYYTEDGKNYYPCSTSSSLTNCLQCENKNKCTQCDTNFHLTEDDKCISQTDIDNNLYYLNSDNRYASCSKISNCEKCTSANECISCKGEYKLVEGEDNIISCQNIDLTYYYKIEGTKLYYRKCSKDIENCEKCSSSTHCNKCKDNFAIIEDIYNICQDLSSEKYYYDDISGKYKLCSTKMTNCEKCSSNVNNFICKQCTTNYAVKYDTNIEFE